MKRCLVCFVLELGAAGSAFLLPANFSVNAGRAKQGRAGQGRARQGRGRAGGRAGQDRTEEAGQGRSRGSR